MAFLASLAFLNLSCRNPSAHPQRPAAPISNPEGLLRHDGAVQPEYLGYSPDRLAVMAYAEGKVVGRLCVPETPSVVCGVSDGCQRVLSATTR